MNKSIIWVLLVEISIAQFGMSLSNVELELLRRNMRVAFGGSSRPNFEELVERIYLIIGFIVCSL